MNSRACTGLKLVFVLLILIAGGFLVAAQIAAPKSAPTKLPDMQGQTPPMNMNVNVNAAPTETGTMMQHPHLTSERQVQSGCVMQEFWADILEVGFMQQVCNGKNLLAIQGNSIYDMNSPDYSVLDVFQKQAGEKEADAVARVAFAKAPAAAKTECEVVPATRSTPDAARYEIAPTAALKAALIQQAGSDAWWTYTTDHCGEYAQTNGIQYFEFQPSRSTFVFMRIGQDVGTIDADTLTFLR